MTDLFEMLGLTSDSVLKGDDPFAPERPREGPGTHANPNALEIDRWGRRRGEDLLAANPDICCDVHAASDFHTAAFDLVPKMMPGCADMDRHAYISELLDSADYRTTHRQTALNAAAADLAAAEYARGWEAVKEACKGVGTVGDRDGERRLAAAVREAAAAAKEQVDTLIEACSGLGMGPGQPGSTDPRAAARVFKRVKDSPRLRKIMEQAGRFRRLAQSKQRTREFHGVGEVVDLTLGGEIERMVPAKLARFAIPGTVLDQYRRVLQRQAMVREHRNPEPVGRGPIVVLVDHSDSMSEYGRIASAKGLALAMAWLAREQGRWCCLASFSHGTDTRLIALPPGQWGDAALMGWLEMFPRGGTTLDVLCHTLPFVEWPKLVASGMARGKTDVILITDGQVSPPDNLPEFTAWKAREKARVISIVIDAGDGYGGVASVSDEVHPVRNLSADTEAAARAVSVG